MNASTWVSSWARIKPEDAAIVFEGHVLTWSQLDRRASHVAETLLDLGAEPGDRVGCLMANRTEYVETFIATLRVGAIFVPLNVLATSTELLALIEDCQARIVVTDQSFDSIVHQMVEHGPVADIVSVDGVLSSDHSLVPVMPDRGVDPRPPVPRSGSDLMCIYYTSGTTGKPKGATVTFDNTHYATLNWLIDLGFSQNDRFLLNLPLCFTGAMAILCPALHGGLTIYLERKFDPGRTLGLIESAGITFMVVVPTMALSMMQHPDFETSDLSSMRMVLCGGAPVAMSLFEVWTGRGVPFISSFGMTEVTGGFTMITPVAQAKERLGTAGRACLYSEAKIIREDGSEADDDEVGELLIGGPLVFAGYWNNDQATRETIVDGWLHTGDMSTRDSNGYFRIVDRKKDTIITGGLNVYPAEVENALIRLAGVAECAAYGVPDDKWGEAVAVSIVCRPGSEPDVDTIRDFCRSQIAAYKVPKHIEIVESLPRTTSGKVVRRALRAEFIDRLAVPN